MCKVILFSNWDEEARGVNEFVENIPTFDQQSAKIQLMQKIRFWPLLSHFTRQQVITRRLKQ